MPDALLIGLSALQAQQRSMEVTSHNIANVATPGYSRQRSELSAPVPEDGNPGQRGRGVDVVAIRRLTDGLLTEQIRKSSTEEGRLGLTNQTLDALQAVFNEPGESSLSGAVNSVFSVFQQLSNNPESPGIRAAAVEEIKTLTEIVNGMGQRLEDLRNDLGSQLALEANTISGLSRQIASLNGEIRRQVATGSQPNDLLDRREGLLTELSGHIDLRVRIDPISQAALVESSGRLIVDGEKSVGMRVGSSQDRLALVFNDTLESVNATSGKAGALLTLHATTIPAVIERLDVLARTFAYEMNAVHAVGVNADAHIDRFLSQTVIASSQLDIDLDALTQIQGNDLGAGIAEPFLPRFTDADGVSQPRDLTINIRNDATGIATKYILRYEPGAGPSPAGRSLQNLIDAVNTGSGGGFSLYPPQAGIPGLTATAIPVDGGVRLELKAAAGLSLDFSRSLDTRPSAEAWNAGWTGPAVDLKGRYTGNLAYDPTNQWRMDVVTGGVVGDSAAPPVVSFTWFEDVAGTPVARTTTATLGAGYGAGQAVAIGDGTYVKFAGGTLTAGQSLDLMVDGNPDEARLLGALGINNMFQGADARTLAIADPLRAHPGRLAVGQTRVDGDNSNILAILKLRQQAIMPGGVSVDDYLTTMVADVGSQVDLSKRLTSNQDAVRGALDNRRDQVSGVSIDEEVGNLILQQQAYTAAARVITTAQENIRTLLDLLG